MVNSVPFFKTGTEKVRFSVPLLMTGRHQIDLPKSKLNTKLYIFCCTSRQKCIKLQRSATIFWKIFWGWHPWTPITGKGKTPLRLLSLGAQWRIHRPIFQSFNGQWSTLQNNLTYLLKYTQQETYNTVITNNLTILKCISYVVYDLKHTKYHHHHHYHNFHFITTVHAVSLHF